MTDPMNNPSERTRLKRHRDVFQRRWSTIDAKLIHYAIDAITNEGAAVLFTRTRDGGSLVIQVLSGEDKFKEYIGEPHEAFTIINWILDDLGCILYPNNPEDKKK